MRLNKEMKPLSEKIAVLYMAPNGRAYEPDGLLGIYSDPAEAILAMDEDASKQITYRPGHSVELMEGGGSWGVWRFGLHVIHEGTEEIAAYMMIEVSANTPGVA